MPGLAEDQKRIGELNTAADALAGLARAPAGLTRPGFASIQGGAAPTQGLTRPGLAAIQSGSVPRFGQTPAGEPESPSLIGRAADAFLHSLGPQNAEMLGAGLRTFGTLQQSEALHDAGAKLERWGQELEFGEPAELPEVDSIGSAIEWATLGVAQGLGSMGPPIAAGAIGGAGGLAAAGPVGAAAGGVGAAFGTNYLMMAGEAVKQFEASGVEPYKAAMAAQAIAPLMAGLDTLGLAKILRGPVRGESDSFLKYLGKRLAHGASAEALTEMAQGTIRELTDAKLSGDPKSEERAKSILQEGIIAGLTGGVVSGAAAPFGARRAPQDTRDDAPADDPLPPEETEADVAPESETEQNLGAVEDAIAQRDARERERYEDLTGQELPESDGTPGEPPRAYGIDESGTVRSAASPQGEAVLGALAGGTPTMDASQLGDALAGMSGTPDGDAMLQALAGTERTPQGDMVMQALAGEGPRMNTEQLGLALSGMAGSPDGDAMIAALAGGSPTAAVEPGALAGGSPTAAVPPGAMAGRGPEASIPPGAMAGGSPTAEIAPGALAGEGPTAAIPPAALAGGSPTPEIAPGALAGGTPAAELTPAALSGEPVKVFHGTRSVADELDPSLSRSREGPAVFFTSDRETADVYANEATGEAEARVTERAVDPRDFMAFDGQGRRYGEGFDPEQVLEEARAQGASGVVFRNIRNDYQRYDGKGEAQGELPIHDIYAVLDREKISPEPIDESPATPARAKLRKVVEEKAKKVKAKPKRDRQVEKVIGPARKTKVGQAGRSALTNAVVSDDDGVQRVDTAAVPKRTRQWMEKQGLVEAADDPVLTDLGRRSARHLQRQAAPPPVQAAVETKGAQQLRKDVAQGKNLTRRVALSGQKETSVTPAGTNVEVEYGVVDLSSVTASHDAQGRPNQAYPTDLQPRDRGGRRSQEQVAEIAAEGRFNPLLLMPSPSTETGAPVVGKDLAVESGNGRVAALQRIYEREATEGGSTAAGQYRAQVDQWAAQHGQSERVAGMNHPVLVRVRTDDTDRRAVAVESNIDPKLSQSATEQAQTDAERLGGLEVIGNQSTAEVRRRFTESLTSGERGSVVLPDGRLSQAGEARVRNAELWEGWRSPRLQRRATEESTAGVKRVVNVLASEAQAAAAARFHGADIDSFVAGLDYWLESQERGESVDFRLSQVDVFADEPAVQGDSEAVARALDEATSEKQVRGVVKGALAELRARGDMATQGDLVGGRPELPLAGVVNQALAEARGQNDMFARQRKGTTGMRKGRVQETVDRITRDWDTDRMPRIEVLANASELPADLYRRLGDNLGDTKGILARYPDGDAVFVVANKMKDADDIQRTILHEVVGHLSMMEMMGADFAPLLAQVWTDRTSGPWRDINREVESNYPDADPDRHAAEMIAHAAERGLKVPLMRRIADAVRATLRNLGFRVATSYGEVMQLLSRAERRLRKPKPAPADQDPDSTQVKQQVTSDALREFYEKRGDDKPKGAGRYIDPWRPIESAFRLMTIPIGGLNAQGNLRIGDAASKASRKIMRELSPAKDGVFGFLAEPLEIARHGWLNRYGTPRDFVVMERQRFANEYRVMQELVGILDGLSSANITAEEAKTLQDVLEGKELDNERMNALAEPIRKRIDELGEEMVKLGLLSKDTYLRNLGQYLHRSYRSYEFEASPLVKAGRKMMRRHRSAIVGDELKRRGRRHNVALGRLMKDVPTDQQEAAAKAKEWEVFDATHPETGKVVRRVYRPKTDAEFEPPATRGTSVWQKAGDFELRTAGDKHWLWRDYTPEERERMGEIRDARYNLIKTFELFSRDLATGKFFQDIARNEDWFQSEKPEGSTPVDGSEVTRFYSTVAGVEWVKVPDAMIPKSNVKRWGALAGGYLRAELWRDMVELDKMQSPNFWDSVLRQWKLNKAPRSPTVHFNNVVGNVFLSELYDFTLTDIHRGALEMFRKGDLFQEAVEEGVFGSGMIQVELKRMDMGRIIEEIEKEVAAQESGGQSNYEKTLGFLGKLYDLPWLRDAYQWEDEVFRMVSYIKDRNTGMEAADAAQNAVDRFLNYDIRAPWPNMLRRSVFPFFSYTYAFVPQWLKAVAQKPWKVAKIATAGYAMMALSHHLVPGDEEAEEAAMSERDTGYTWAGLPKMLRLPAEDERGNPIYVGMTRVLPGGGMAEMDTNQLGLPEWMMVTGPILVAAEVLLNRISYTGQDIVDEVDTGMEKAQKRMTYLWRAAMPNLPFMPKSWNWEMLSRAFGDELDMFGREFSPGLALARQVGPRLYPFDVEAEKARRMMEINRDIRHYRAKLRELQRDKGRNRIGDDAYKKGVKRIQKGMRRLADKAKKVQGG